MSPVERPVIGIVGSAGAYGRWLTRFFQSVMGLDVLGHDPVDADSLSPDAILSGVDVLVFCAPIRQTPAIIARWVEEADGREAGQLWLDVTSVKTVPVAAMLASRAEVAGLHPMCAPPKSPTLKGRAMVVCRSRLDRWSRWLETLCTALQAQCVEATPDAHDRTMALVQALVHAGALSQAGVLRDHAPEGGLASLMPFRSVGFELDMAGIGRILALNPAIYEDIQFGNPHVQPVLASLRDQIQTLHDLVGQGDEAARSSFRQQYLDENRDAFGPTLVTEGNHGFERMGYLLADLAGDRGISVHLPEDRPGSLRRLLETFELAGINLASIHSSRTPAGELHFRLGIGQDVAASVLDKALAVIEAEGIGRLVAP